MVRKKTTTKRTTKVAEQAFPMRDAIEALMTIPEIAESFSTADLELALDDRGWLASYRTSTQELSPRRRTELVNWCRILWHKDPLAKQAVRLWTDYAVGTGITYKADEPKIQKQLDKIWKYRKNKRLTSSRGQQRLSKKVLVDGEVFFAIFTNGDVPVIRTIDCLQTTEIICDPDDEEEALCYKRVTTSAKDAEKTFYYKDWCADDDDLTDLKDPETGKAITLEENVVVYHLPFDELARRGNGLLSSIADWSSQHRRFMTARVAITQALAKFAWKLTAKGGQKLIDSIQQRLQSSMTNTGLSGGLERNPPIAPGGTFAQNQGVDMTPMPRATGAGDAKTDGDQLKLMVCAGTNIMQHYFGDPSTGNLATAEAMELPMLKSFTGFQELWKDAWRDLFSILLEEDIDAEPAVIHITLPSMLQDDLRKLGQFLTGLHQVFPQIEIPEILQICLVALGVNNVEEVMKSAAARKTELTNSALATLPHQLPTVVKVPGKKGAPTAEASLAEAEVEGLNRLADILEKMDKAPGAPTIPEIHMNPEIKLPTGSSKKTGRAWRDEKTGKMMFEAEQVNSSKKTGKAWRDHKTNELRFETEEVNA